VIRLVGGPLGGVLYVLFGFHHVVALDVVSFNIPRLAWDVALFTLIGPPAVCFLVTASASSSPWTWQPS
jgi:predicted ferric reductase